MVDATAGQQPADIIEGVKLMMLGMGIVFLFLVLLFGAITAFGKILPQEEEPVPAAPKNTPPAKDGAKDSEITAVISAAIAAFRKSKGQ